jgi:hypothetical protein
MRKSLIFETTEKINKWNKEKLSLNMVQLKIY